MKLLSRSIRELIKKYLRALTLQTFNDCDIKFSVDSLRSAFRGPASRNVAGAPCEVKLFLEITGYN